MKVGFIAYNSGDRWHCDVCRKDSSLLTEKRWICDECKYDICFDCFKPPEHFLKLQKDEEFARQLYENDLRNQTTTSTSSSSTPTSSSTTIPRSTRATKLPLADNEWQCPTCKHRNHRVKRECSVCGRSNPTNSTLSNNIDAPPIGTTTNPILVSDDDTNSESTLGVDDDEALALRIYQQDLEALENNRRTTSSSSPSPRVSSRRRSARPVQPNWTCSACQFQNRENPTACEICDTPRVGASAGHQAGNRRTSAREVRRSSRAAQVTNYHRSASQDLQHVRALIDRYSQMTGYQPTGYQGETGNVDVDSMSYEQLLSLGERMGKAVKGGLSSGEIDQFPTRVFHEKIEKGKEKEALKKRCVICQDDFVEGDQLRTLGCLHSYHRDCIDPWLKDHHTCPICKHSFKQ